MRGGAFLSPGGVFIPRRDLLWAALIEDTKLYRPYAEPWLQNDYGLDLRAGQPLVVNTWRKVNAKPDQLLVAPQRWATLDYRSIEQPDVTGELAWTAERAGTAHGLVVWFDAELADGIGFSNAPGQPELIYGQAFFPLQAPVELSEGDNISVTLRADLVDGDYVWQWSTRVTSPSDAGRVKASFRQSTFYGAPLSLDKLKQREAGYIPPPAQAAEIDQFVLSMMDGRTSRERSRRAWSRGSRSVFHANRTLSRTLPTWRKGITLGIDSLAGCTFNRQPARTGTFRVISCLPP